MPAKVVDASIAAALFFHEPREQEAARLLGAADLYAPTLLPYELESVARRKIVKHPALRSPIEKALDIALTADITLVEVLHRKIPALALETGLTTYDASYLQISRLLGLPLVTFDERLRKAADR